MSIIAISEKLSFIKSKLGLTKYGEFWQNPKNVDIEWYESIFNGVIEIHKEFLSYLDNLKPKETLEIGCGMGMYVKKYPELLGDYTGIDISKPSISYCIKNYNNKFINADFIGYDFGQQKYELVFSTSVIDHVKQINEFLRKSIQVSKRHVYISTYRGYFPELEQHKQKLHPQGYYLNDISVKEIKSFLINEMMLSENQFDFKEISSELDGDKEHTTLVIRIDLLRTK